MPSARATHISSGAGAATRSLQPDDLYRLRVPSQVRLAPDGRLAVFALRASRARRDGYVDSIWGVPTDGSEEPRQLTLGAWHDTSPRISPDGRLLAFLSDRRTLVEPARSPRRRRRDKAATREDSRPGLRLAARPPGRGVAGHGSSARRNELRVVARWQAPCGPEPVGRGNQGRGPAATRHRRAGGRRNADIGLPIRGPALVPSQRSRLCLRQPPAAVGRGSGLGQCPSPDERRLVGGHAGLVARRHSDRVLHGRAARRRLRPALAHLRRRRRLRSPHSHHGRRQGGFHRSDLASRRPDDRLPRPPLPRPRRQPVRRLALQGRRLRLGARRRPQPVGPPRSHAGDVDEQRHHDGRARASGGVRGWCVADIQPPRSTARTSCGGSPRTTAGSSG